MVGGNRYIGRLNSGAVCGTGFIDDDNGYTDRFNSG